MWISDNFYKSSQVAYPPCLLTEHNFLLISTSIKLYPHLPFFGDAGADDPSKTCALDPPDEPNDAFNMKLVTPPTIALTIWVIKLNEFDSP